MKVGVIGLGSIGSRHAANLTKLGHEVYGYDPNKQTQDLKFVCENSEALVIASPTDFHYHHVCAAVLRGIPVFIEKPIGTFTYPVMVPCMVGYNLRFHPCVKKAKEWMPRIGKPIWANFTVAQYNDRPEYRRDGVILNWSHEIDLALHLLGPATVGASATMLDSSGQDTLSDMILLHTNGCRSQIHLDYLTRPERRHFTIVGEEGRITCNLPERNIFINHKDLMDWFPGKGTWDDDYVDEMKAFISLCNGHENEGCSYVEANAVVDICNTVRKQAGL